jgi:ribosomal protein S18 acetylase RimI-like enzyme
MMNIREYETKDKEQLKTLIAELQDHEAEYLPDMKPGSEIAERYLEYILKSCEERDGVIYIAEDDDQLAGFLWFYIRRQPTDIMYNFSEDVFVEIGDYVVTKGKRNQGIGKALMKSVEEYAVNKQVKKVRLNVMAKNHTAREVYDKIGFEEVEIILEKLL